MMWLQSMQVRVRHGAVCLIAGLTLVSAAQAALFEDDEARKAILDLRQRVESMRTDADQLKNATKQDNASLTQGMLDLHRQLELLRAEVATLRGANEQLSKELSDLQKFFKDDAQSRQTLAERMARLEPAQVNVDGIEFVATPGEKRDFEAALAVFRRGDFVNAQKLFVSFVERYPASGYAASSLFWLGNAQYATRDYKEAVINFRALVARNPEHMRAPEAVLSIANCQLELKDVKGARKTLTDLIKAYPKSEAAGAAKERLVSLK